jgi:superfamily II DNA or RNA helicase
MPTVYDNIENYLIDGLEDVLKVSFRSDFCVGYFNLRGWKKIADHIDLWSGEDNNRCRLLVGMQRPPLEMLKDFHAFKKTEVIDRSSLIRLKKRLAEEFKQQLTIGIPTNEDEKYLQILSNQLKKRKLAVKLYLRTPLHAKLYLLFRNEKVNPINGFLGSSNLTLSGIEGQGELNVDVVDKDATLKLAKWFEDRWEDRLSLDISEELAEIIDNSWASEKLIQPYHIYLKIAYHLAREARAGLNEFNVPEVFKNDLFEFQQNAVQIAAHHLNKRGGVLIGDVVGLGKTITATALAKIFEDDFLFETLIICPKNLVQMWQGYIYKYNLRAQAMSISEVQKKLPELRRFNVVIIDESHNLRNREGVRYKVIQEYIRKNDCKVILLSATPYNKSYIDLSSQLRLFIPEDRDLGIRPERFLESIGGEVQFKANYQYLVRSLPAFEKSEFIDDWRELMRLFLVRRTRSFIKEYYSTTDDRDGRKFLEFADGSRSYFPDRIPRKVEFEFNPDLTDDQYARLYSDKVVEIINELILPRYGLANYLKEKPEVKPSPQELLVIENLSRAGKRLIGFSRTNLFKRLESSGFAFLLSLSRLVIRNYVFLYAIENKLPLPIGQQEANILDDILEDLDLDTIENDEEPSFNLIIREQDYLEIAQKLYAIFSAKKSNNFTWINSSLFDSKLLKNLKNDCANVIEILKLSSNWKASLDRKLNALYQLIENQHGNEKILVFSQFADTVNYITDRLVDLGVKKIESVTGNDENPTEKAHRFSPVSNDRKDCAGTDEELRILIATDVLSEGQNLQDAHVIVNFDLPWAIIRLIQRAGRVDRIGQKSNVIFCYSFLPEDGIEKIIRLRSRLLGRLGENADVVGSDETFFEEQVSENELRNLYNEKSGILDDNESGEIDLSSFAYEIWKQAIDENPKLKKIIPELPNVSHSSKQINNADKQGVLVYSRTQGNNDILTWVNKEGKIVTQSQYEILLAAQCTPNTPAMPRNEVHYNLVGQVIENIVKDENAFAGALGRKTDVKYKVYIRLKNYYEKYKNALFVNNEVVKAIDEISKFPLKEFGRNSLNRQLKSGITDDNLVELVLSLREENKLCNVSDIGQENENPQIICSMGLVSNEI